MSAIISFWLRIAGLTTFSGLYYSKKELYVASYHLRISPFFVDANLHCRFVLGASRSYETLSGLYYSKMSYGLSPITFRVNYWLSPYPYILSPP
ncbi:hypothetical protein CEXT_5161 [Caerostris extrusa]|uniref:Secreted protein n=1 Tax=Caerostris extrusa TaxID=172846 RepID=A0AAV4PJE9_CAEEX|nr:hypothetical protein CEXT_5161 [Caerostris extrusa]